MSTATVREIIVDALGYANALEDLPGARLTAFADGGQDIALDELVMDSLARMELLIALEVTHGVTVTPQELGEIATLGALADMIATRATEAAGAATTASATGAESAAATASVSEAREVPDAPALPPIAALYRRALRSCRTQNQVNQLHIRMDNRLTPGELAILRQWHATGALTAEQRSPELAAMTDAWFQRLDTLVAPCPVTTPEPFTMTRVCPSALLYRGPGAPADKTLIIAFGTRGGRMMMPQPVFLQHLDARCVDVLMITDVHRNSYETGVPLLGDSVDAVIDWISQLDWLHDYARLHVAGCSGGGYPAVLAALRLDADLGVSLGGRFPPGRHAIRARWAAKVWSAARARSRRASTPRIRLVYGADKTRDFKFARAMRWGCGGELVPLTLDDDVEVGHMVLTPLRERGVLRDFLVAELYAPADTGTGTGAG